MKTSNLIALFINKAAEDKGIITYINGELEEKRASIKELYKEAKELLHELQLKGIKPGDELVFQLADNESMVRAFWASILGGIIPIPLPVGVGEEQQSKVTNILKTLTHPHILTTQMVLTGLQGTLQENLQDKRFQSINDIIILMDDIVLNNESCEIYQAEAQDVAMIQFSSGSTGMPKGVVLTHEMIISGVLAMESRADRNPDDVMLTWLPLSHTMGLIATHIYPIYFNVPLYVMPTELFLKNPMLWMKKTSEYKATMLFAPNFALNYFVSLFKEQYAQDWDLSSVKFIINGGEPVAKETCDIFLKMLEKYGMKSCVMTPSYGMSESASIITVSDIKRGFTYVNLDRDSVIIGQHVEEIDLNNIENSSKKVTFVSVGTQVTNCMVKIYNDEGFELGEDIIGNIWVRGVNIFNEYYKQPEETKNAYSAEGWFKTGDVGFVRDGELFITGRAKDIIFVNGKNYYPHDIEDVAEKSGLIHPGTVAACGVYNREIGTDDIIIFIQTKQNIEAFTIMAEGMKKYLSRQMGLEIANVVPMDMFPRTASGKIQKYKLVRMYEDNNFESVLGEMKNHICSDSVQATCFNESITPMEQQLIEMCKEIVTSTTINIKEGLLENGFNSLKTSILCARIYKENNVNISLDDALRAKTLKDIALMIENNTKCSYHEIKKIAQQDSYTLSSSQKRIYMLSQLESNNTNYNLPYAMLVQGKIDKNRLEKAFQSMIDRHEILRTTFEMKNGELVQVVHPFMNFTLNLVSADEKDVSYLLSDLVLPFVLSQGPLIRAVLIDLNEDKKILFIDMHHIISDGTSMGIFRSELLKLYYQEKLLPLELQYKEYAVWQNERLKSEEMKLQESYWLKQFSEEPEALNLPTDFPRPSLQSVEGSRASFVIENHLSKKIHQLVIDKKSTLYMVLLAAYNVLLFKYTNQSEIIVGTPIAGRTNTEIQNVMGMFVNTLAMKNAPSQNKTFSEFLQEVKENAFKAYENQEYQFDMLVEKLNIARELSKNPLFDTMFIVQDVNNELITTKDFTIIPYSLDRKTSLFDITIEVTDRVSEIHVEIEYCTQLFQLATIERLFTHYINILNSITENPYLLLADVAMVNEDEIRTINQFNHTEYKIDFNETINSLFQKQAIKAPKNKAVLYNNRTVTYEELDKKSNSLARYLRKLGIEKESRVGIIGERSPEIIIGVLGIIKAGASFVPLNYTYPQENLNYMLKDCNAQFILKYHFEKNFLIKEIDLECKDIFEEDDSPVENITDGSNLLYTIYTSGTTGKPKGAMIEHKNIVNLIQFEFNNTNINFGGKSLQFTTMSFDVCYQEIFSTLLKGGELYIIDEDSKKDVKILFDFINDNKIETVFLPTAFLKLIMSDKKYCSEIPLCIKHIVTAGEQLIISKEFISSLENRDIYLHNHYGPSETHVVTTKTLHKEDIQLIPSIGNPIVNTKIYILDEKMKHKGIGIPGELYIAGDSVGRGYINNRELTKERFIDDPFCPGSRMYKTGDLARWLPNGEIYFMGRLDHQVKIRGFRVEVGGIETQLVKHSSIKDACVIVKKNEQGLSYLCAYIVCTYQVEETEIREYLAQELPDYMIPSYFVQLDKIPLNSHGKVDRKLLPEPEVKSNNSAEYCGPKNDLEQKVGEIWCNVLGGEQINVNGNFFEQNGNSLSAVTLASKLNQELGVEIPLKEIFRHPTIREISCYISKAEKNSHNVIETLSKTMFYPVSSAQKRILILSKIEDLGIRYNMPVVLSLAGELNVSELEHAFNQLIQRHEILRTTFRFISDEPVQKVHDFLQLKIDSIEAKETEIKKYLEDFIQPFNLAELPLMRIKLLKHSEQKYTMLLDFHHIIIDGYSMSILINELMQLYQGIRLPELRIQYSEFSFWHNNLLKSDMAKSQEKYWLKKLENFKYTELPVDNVYTNSEILAGNKIQYLDTELAKNIQKYCIKKKITNFVFYISILNIVISKEIGQKDLSIGIPIENRKNQDLEKLIGLFLNVIIIRSNMDTCSTFEEYIMLMKDIVFEALDNQDYPYDELYSKIKQNKEFAQTNLFSLFFNYLPFDSYGELTFDKIKVIPNSDYEILPKYDLTFYVNEMQDGLRMNLVYKANLYNSHRIERILVNYVGVCSQVINNEQIKIDDICFIDTIAQQFDENAVCMEAEFDNDDFML
ncbi:non-ribosomal peptide synthetase [Anaeromicropila populeti]|uniref:Amino acid adenylation domain-containing protein n=1 Tax=Anaeromicropila populeti TaxID=37658 RepID=A0A1I6IZS6_9FIRM|nr:non-ribosomal peptide synthetase [Anaeromicropila populeti]SFR72173.1 amino acid adenylation domain-containing protein [Anaeromicropila populeti]